MKNLVGGEVGAAGGAEGELAPGGWLCATVASLTISVTMTFNSSNSAKAASSG